MAKKSKPINRIGRDVSRHVAGGARSLLPDNRSVPHTVAIGRQMLIAEEDYETPVEVHVEGQKPVEFSGHLGDPSKPNEEPDVKTVVDRITRTIGDASNFDLREDRSIPTWVFHQRVLPVPDDAPEEQRVRIEEGTSMLHVDLCNPAVLREAESARLSTLEPVGDPVVTLHASTPVPDQPGRKKLTPIQSWRPSIMVRCPIVPAGIQGGTPGASTKDGVFTLRGIPQSDRVYLDRMGLLDNPTMGLPAGSQLRLLVEATTTVNDESITRLSELHTWTIARTDLTRLARPAQTLTLTGALSGPYPFVATQDEQSDSIRLIQMASITNRGGYHIRLPGVPSFQASTSYSLLVVVLLPAKSATGGTLFPAYANSVSQVADSRLGDRAIRFEGPKHTEIDAYAPPGTVALGVERVLHWPELIPNEPESAITAPRGFAESVHLVELDVLTKAGCVQRGDCSAPLFPGDASSRSENAALTIESVGGGVAARAMSPHAGPPRMSANEDSERRHSYRSIVRYAETNVYAKLASATTNMLKVAVRLRDLNGNRIAPGNGTALEFERRLFYTDALISPAEWPGFDFQFAPGDPGYVNLRILYKSPESAELDDSDLLSLPSASRRGTESAADPRSYIFDRLTPSAQRALSVVYTRAMYRELSEAKREVTRDLNSVIRGYCIHDPERFAETELDGRTRSLIRRGDRRTGSETAFLNRRLVEAAYNVGTEPQIHRAKELDLKREHRLRMRLIAILDQLNGTGTGDVAVSLRDGAGAFRLEVLQVDIAQELREMLEAAIAGGASSSKELKVSVEHTRTSPSRFDPAVQIERTDDRYLPTDDDLPIRTGEFGTVRSRIDDQVRRTSAQIRIGDEAAYDPENRPFDQIAERYRLDGNVTSIAKNRFGEHELWFIPERFLPRANRSVPFVYRTACPLSNRLRSTDVPMPSFRVNGEETSGASVWHEFPWNSENASNFHGLDLDLLARSLFGLGEALISPERVTGSDAKSVWEPLLRAKDVLATKLADDWLITLLMSDAKDENRTGGRLMAADAFRRDLRAFYQVDTIVGFPVQMSPDSDEVLAYTGKLIGDPWRSNTDQPSGQRPVFSDLVLEIDSDTPSNEGTYLTATYDLPANTEPAWADWKIERLEVRITHIQLPAYDGSGVDEFGRGKWLELVGAHASADLKWEPNEPIPAITRRYPDEPILHSVSAHPPPGMERLSPDGFGIASSWGWDIEFEPDPAGDKSDTIYLEVSYASTPEEAPGVRSQLGPDKPYGDLVSALVVAEALAAHYPESDPARLNNWASATADLYTDIAQYLSVGDGITPAQARADALPSDRFTIIVDKLDVTAFDDNRYVDQQAVALMKGSEGRYRVVSKPGGGSLRLLGSISGQDPRFFRPSLVLRRNDRIGIDLSRRDGVVSATRSELIYECGPVTWPGDVRVTTSIPAIRVSEGGVEQLQKILSRILGSLFGATTPEQVMLRLDLSHVFSLGDLSSEFANPFLVLPADFKGYGDASDLARVIAESYNGWLSEQTPGKSAQEILDAVSKPMLGIGLRLTAGVGGREDVYLEIGRILVPLKADEA